MDETVVPAVEPEKKTRKPRAAAAAPAEGEYVCVRDCIVHGLYIRKGESYFYDGIEKNKSFARK